MLFPETERAEGVEREMGSEEIEAEEEVLLSWQVTHHRRLVGRPPLLLTCLRAPHRLNPCLRIWCFFFPPLTFFPAFLLPTFLLPIPLSLLPFPTEVSHHF